MSKLKRDEEEKRELTQKFADLKSAKIVKFYIEPQGTNILQCVHWEIDTWLHWIIEEKKGGANVFYCIRCATRHAKYLSETSNKVNFYFKYEKKEIQKFFKRLEHRIKSPTNYDCSFPQNRILLKDDWPTVRTKQDLDEENLRAKEEYDRNPSKDKPLKLIKVNYYGNSGNNDFEA